MAELEVDQSNLPRVQEVSQYFSVLEDGALAHNLQEQEIEQYYSSNVQRSQLVQKDIRVAKRLQDEEHQRAEILNQQTIRQLEEQDSEYARRVQEEIQHAAEEERKREEKDEEIAKRIQEEEEELYVRQRNSCRRTNDRVNSNTMGSPNTLQPSQHLFSKEEELAWRSRVHSPSPSTSDYEEDHDEIRRPSNREYRANFEQRHRPVLEMPLRRRSVQSRSSFASQSSTALGGWGDVVQLIKNDLLEQGYLSCSSDDEIFEPVYKLERILSQRQQAPEWRGNQRKRLFNRSSMIEGNRQSWQGDGRSQMARYRHSDYKDSRSVRSEGRLVRRYSSRDGKSGDAQRRVHFQDDQQRHNFYIDSHKALVRSHGGERELSSCSVRPLDRRVPPMGEEIGFYRCEAGRVRNSVSEEIREEVENNGRFRERARWEGRNGVRPEHRSRAHSVREEWRQEERVGRQYRGEPRRRCMRSELRQGNQEDMSSTDEEEMDRDRERRRVDTRIPRHPRRSVSVSCRGHSPGPGQRVNRTPLDLGELGQALQDEELARRLQAEEEELLRGDLLSPSSYPKGDFTVAQVAQDEEIAHYIQKQELKAELQSQELENYDSGRGYREMSHVYDRREVCDGQMSRDRLDSEELVSSPGEECCPEYQPSSPVTLARQQHPFRNIAEELDPTFHKQESVQAATSIPDIQATQRTGLCEDPTIVMPTKRQNDKLGSTKSKVKKENSKTKENCKQQ